MRFAQHMMTWQNWAQKSQTPFDFVAMLKEIKEAGFDGVEIGGDEASLGKPAEVRRLFADQGLEIAAFGAGVTANPWPPNTEQYQREMDYAAELGVKTLAVCGGFFPRPRRNSFDSDYKLFAENLLAASEYAHKNGQVIAFHPHVGCMVETIAEVEWLWKYIPDLPLCVDTGHLVAVRSDPVTLIKSYPDKVAHLHLKDWSDQRWRFANLGDGDTGLDFVEVLRSLNEIHYTGWLAVELDDPLISAGELAQQSRQFLRTCEAAIS